MPRDELLDFAGVGQLLAVRPLPDVLEYFGSRVYADVGGDERILQLVEQVRIDFFSAGDGVFQPVHQPGASLLNAGFQAFQQVRFLFCGAE